VECAWDTKRGGWIARHDDWMCSSVPGLYVAGEITGIAGADVAADEGRLAAVGCALALGRIPVQRAMDLARPLRGRLRRLNRFAGMLSALSWPGAMLFEQLAGESATLCKCEEVTVGEFLHVLQQNPQVATANAAKLISRAGMGLCQGRYCQYAVTRLMAGRLNLPESEVGSFTARFPAKPIEIDDRIGSDA
jgi:hypothetical protein